MKTVTVTVTCDTCGKDIAYTNYEAEHRIVVMSQNLPVHPDAVAIFGMVVLPPLDRDYYFCNLRCLRAHFIATGEAPTP